MTLTRVNVRNYQSLHEVDIALEPFTVIVGATSSGKSAFTRALRTLIANTRGNAFISHGQPACTLTGTLDDGTTISLTRGRSSAHDAYTVTRGTEQQRFTKLGGSIPPEVSGIFGIDPADPLTFATQFDRPYLLADTPGQVAATFGALTNVSIIFEASKEARRIKTATASVIKTRSGDLAAAMDRLPGIRDLGRQKAALTRAETTLEQARAIKADIEGIEALDATVTQATEKISALPPTPADIADLIEVARSIDALTAILVTIKQATTAVQQAERDISTAAASITQAQQGYDDLLHQAGTCPTCGQGTDHVHGAAA